MNSFNSDQSVEELNKVFVGQFNGEMVTQRKLLRCFQHHGRITDIDIFKNNLDGSIRLEAFAFISYMNPEQILQAIHEENGREWLGRRLKWCKAFKNAQILLIHQNLLKIDRFHVNQTGLITSFHRMIDFIINILFF